MSQIQPLWLQGSGILDVTDHPPQSSWKGWEWAGRNSSCVAVSKHERKARKDEGFLWGNWEESAEWEHTESSRYGWIGDCEHEVYCWAKKKESICICSFGYSDKGGWDPVLMGLFMAEQARDVSAWIPLSEIVFRAALRDLRGEWVFLWGGKCMLVK